MVFTKAVKRAAKLRLALVGPSGSGKTYSALSLASALANGQPIAVVDTERGSASKYADLFSFDVMELDNFHPNRYVEAIAEATQAGYAVVVLDSLSHAWNGRGGILEIVQRKGNNFQAWGEVKPIENALIDAITNAGVHVIATMRSKTEYVVEQNDRGKSAPRKVGTAPVQRDGMEYEFDIFGELDQENTLTVNKSRCPSLAGAVIPKPGAQMAATLAAWLSGAAPADLNAPAPVPAPSAAQPARKPAPPTATATASAKPAESVTAAQWDQLKRRMFNEAKIETPAQFQAFTQAHLKRDLGGELPTLAEYDKLIAATNRAAAQVRTVARTARPADAAPSPSAEEMAAGQADYDASQGADQDFPPADNDIDLSKLPMGAMPS